MPGLNGTGPMGIGPMTGGARGLCSGKNAQGYNNPAAGRGGMGYGRGRGRGGGFGRGLGRWFAARWNSPGLTGTPYGTGLSAQEEVNALRNQAKIMQDQINQINTRIKELESNA